MSILRTCAVTVLLVPTLVLCAADKQSRVTPVSLINQTIPTYGVVNQVPHYTDSRANTLYLEIHQVLAEVESHVMSGKSVVAKPVDPKKNKKAADTDKKAIDTDKKPADIAPTSVIGDARLSGLLSRLVELDARITYRTYLEQWQIDNSFSDLARAAEMQLLSGYVTAETAASVQQARAKVAAEPKVETPKVEAPKVEPKAEPKIEAPKVEVPAAPAVEAPAAEPAPAAPAVEAPAAEPAPAVEAPAAEPAPAVVPPPEL